MQHLAIVLWYIVFISSIDCHQAFLHSSANIHSTMPLFLLCRVDWNGRLMLTSKIPVVLVGKNAGAYWDDGIVFIQELLIDCTLHHLSLNESPEILLGTRCYHLRGWTSAFRIVLIRCCIDSGRCGNIPLKYCFVDSADLSTANPWCESWFPEAWHSSSSTVTSS